MGKRPWAVSGGPATMSTGKILKGTTVNMGYYEYVGPDQILDAVRGQGSGHAGGLSTWRALGAGQYFLQARSPLFPWVTARGSSR